MVKTRGRKHERRDDRCCRHGIYQGSDNVLHWLGGIPIDILFRDDSFCDLTLTLWGDMIAEGKLDENTANLLVGVEGFDHIDNLFDGSLCRELNVPKFDTDLFCSLGLHANIGRRVWTSASLDNDELGLEAGKGGLFGTNAVSDAIANGLGDGSAVYL